MGNVQHEILATLHSAKLRDPGFIDQLLADGGRPYRPTTSTTRVTVLRQLTPA
jgi:hypothetical protein